jgi:tetratricopeptide (TPR) repeat protein
MTGGGAGASLARPDAGTGRQRLRWACAAFLVLAAMVTYAGAPRAGFIWDDDMFLTENPLIRASDGLRRLWFSGEPVDYWPVTSSTLWFEWRLWGLNPAGYHLVNVLLHALEVLLVWRVLTRLRVPGAFLAAAVFAVHPVNVDTVMWITQRKNLMAMLFYLASILLFLKAEDSRPGGVEPRVWPLGKWLWLSLASFALAMLSKGSVAMLPVVLLGIVAWRRTVTWRDAARLAPFFAVAAVLTFLNFRFTVHSASEVASTAGFAQRLLGAGAVVWFYLLKAFVPVHLMFIYPQWAVRVSDPLWWLPLGAALGLTALLWLMRRSWGRGPLFAWLYFCVSLVPVMGFTDVYFMHYSLVSDHYEHLALIGAIAAAAAAFALWRRSAQGPLRLAGDAAAALVLACLAWLSSAQCADYANVETLWRTSIARNPRGWIAYDNLATELLRQGRAAQAEALCREGLRLEPDQPRTRATLGIALDSEGRFDEAIAELRASAAAQPGVAQTYDNLGKALMDAGRMAEAVANFEAALGIDPSSPKTLNNLGTAYAREGRLDDAVACLRRALAIRGDFAEAHYNLGNALHGQGRDADAEAEFRLAIASDPGLAGARVNLGNILLGRGRLDEAIAQYRRALELNPRLANARHNLEVAVRERASP